MDKPVEYEQTDPRWRNIPYTSTGNPNETIGTDGCGPTCAAMVVATLRDRAVKPDKAAWWFVQNRGVSPHDGTYWFIFGRYFSYWKIPCTQTDDKSLAKAALAQGRMVISAMRKGHWTIGGHFILAYGLEGGKVLIHDPNSEASYRERGNLNDYLTEAAQFWIIEEDWREDDVKYYEKITEVPDWAKPTVQKAISIGVLKGSGSGLHLSEDSMKMLVYMDRMGLITKVYEQIADLPDWAKPTIQKVIDKGILKGDGSGLHLSEDNMKMFIYMDRMGLIK